MGTHIIRKIAIALITLGLILFPYITAKGRETAETSATASSPYDMVLVHEISPPKPKKAENTYASCETYRGLVSQYDWDVEIALKIMSLESQCRSGVINDNPNTGDYSVGLFQINLYGANARHRPSEEWLKVPENNVAYAYKLYSWRGNWSDWTTYVKIVK